MVEKEEGTEETRKKEEKEGGGRNRYCMWSIEPKIVSVWLFIETIQQPQFYSRSWVSSCPK